MGCKVSQSRRRLLVPVLISALALAACTGGSATDPTNTPTSSPTATSGSPTATAPTPTSTSTSDPTPSPDPTITVDPVPVLPGTARGRVIFVQQAEDASLVAGGRPIRLTLTRTANIASWFSAPAQRRAGQMSTEQMLLSLGWRPAADGATDRLPKPRPQALLAYAGGALPFTIQRANVRADGTLVLDIAPIGPAPETVDSYGPVSLSIDGVPGVRVQRAEITAGLTSITTITGRNAQQVTVQFVDDSGDIIESRFLAPDRPEVRLGPITVESGARLDQVVMTLRTPTSDTRGAVDLTGVIDLGGTPVPLEATIARWTLPKR